MRNENEYKHSPQCYRENVSQVLEGVRPHCSCTRLYRVNENDRLRQASSAVRVPVTHVLTSRGIRVQTA
jgi:hypothetical protein